MVGERSRTMQKLIFVYNGDSGLLNGVMHYLHKRISPETYPCRLCGIIYDGTELNKDWLAFVKKLDVPAEFLHRDEFRAKYGEHGLSYPVVLSAGNGASLETLISAEDFNSIGDLQALKDRLRAVVG